MTMPTVADIIGKRLYEAGCRHAYGIPGGEVLGVMKGLDDAGIEFVLVKHENSGGFMAEGGFHRNGAPGILVATLGPGVANAINVIANAWQDRVPMIFLTGCVDESEAASYTHQVFDHAALLRPVTKASLRMNAEAVDVLIDKALAIALDDPPGPVHIDVPISVAAAVVAKRSDVRRARLAPTSPAPSEAITEARAWLAQAKRPVVIAGVEALHHRADSAVRQLVDEFRVPLITTYKAKGIVKEDHAMVLGGAGLSPAADTILLPVVREADLIILAGYDPIEMRANWRNVWAAEKRVIEFSACASVHYMHTSSHCFVGDVGAGLRTLMAGTTGQSRWREVEVEELKTAMRGRFGADDAWGPAAIVDEARRALPAGTVATVDSGAHRIVMSQVWQCDEARALLQSSALCTMGCALPLAIGARIADPRKPCVAFVGDACLEMTLGELATARDAGAPVIVIVFADQSLSLIEIKQRANQMPNLGVDFQGTDFAGVATAMGGFGVTVDSRAALREAIEGALAADTFTVISCRLPRRAYEGRL